MEQICGASLAQVLALNGRPKLDPCHKFAQTCPGSPNLPQHPLTPLLCCKSFFFTITFISNQALSYANDSRDHGCQIRPCTFSTIFKITVGVGASTFSLNPLFKITVRGKHPSTHYHRAVSQQHFSQGAFFSAVGFSFPLAVVSQDNTWVQLRSPERLNRARLTPAVYHRMGSACCCERCTAYCVVVCRVCNGVLW